MATKRKGLQETHWAWLRCDGSHHTRSVECRHRDPSLLLTKEPDGQRLVKKKKSAWNE